MPQATGRPEVAVVIPCYDLGRTLEDALDSALAQTRPVEEVVVVDDGSTDVLTRQVLARLSRPRTRVLRRPHGGVARARNHGARATASPLLMFLDADDVLAPEAIEAMVATLEGDQALGFVSCEVQAFEGASYRWRPPAVDVVGTLARGSVHVSSLVRRAAFDRVGGFDPELPGYEDQDFWLRVLRAGYRGTVLDQALLFYRVRSGSRYRAAVAHDVYSSTMARLYERHHDVLEHDGIELLRQKHDFLLELRDHRAWLESRRKDGLDLVKRAAEAERAESGPVEERPVAWAESRIKQAIESWLIDVAWQLRGDVCVIADAPFAVETVHMPRTTGAVTRRALGADSPEACGASTLVFLTFTSRGLGDDVVRQMRDHALRGATVLLAVPLLAPSPPLAETRHEPSPAATLLRDVLARTCPPESFDVAVHTTGLVTAVLAVPDAARPRDEWQGRGESPIARPSSGLVLAYHRVARLEPDTHRLCIPPDVFAAHMHYLRDQCTTMPAGDLVTGALQGVLPPRAVAITFDDGYLDALTTAAPILRDLGIPATFFVNTEGLDADHEGWHDVVERVLLGDSRLPDVLDLALPGVSVRLPVATRQERVTALRHLHGYLLDSDVAGRRALVDALVEWSGTADEPRAGWRVLRAEEVRQLAHTPGCEVGSHTAHHLRLTRHGADTVRAELSQAKMRLEALVGRTVSLLAYPFGDHDAATADAARDTGHRYAFSVESGVVSPQTDPMRVPRVEVPACDLDAFAALIRRWLDPGAGQERASAQVTTAPVLDPRVRSSRRNEVLSRAEVASGETTLRSRPQFVIVDPTSRCNARCVMCPVSFRAPGDRGRDVPERVIDQLLPALSTAAHVNLFSSGEPTIAAGIESLVRRVTSIAPPDAVVWVSTNGKRVPESFLEALDASPRIGLQFSVDGGTREVFEAIRRGITFEQLVDSLERAAMRRDARGWPRLAFSSTMSKRNIHDLANIFALAARFGVEHVSFYDEDPEVPEEEAFVLDEGDRPAFESQRAAIDASGVAYSNGLRFRGLDGLRAVEPPVPDPAPRLTCVAPWRVFHQRADGTVRTCCTLRRSMGDLGTGTFEDVWNGPEYVALRRAFVEQRGIPGTCYRCTDPLRHWGE